MESDTEFNDIEQLHNYLGRCLANGHQSETIDEALEEFQEYKREFLESVKGIKEALTDVKNGARLYPLEEVDAELRHKYGIPKE